MNNVTAADNLTECWTRLCGRIWGSCW